MIYKISSCPVCHRPPRWVLWEIDVTTHGQEEWSYQWALVCSGRTECMWSEFSDSIDEAIQTWNRDVKMFCDMTKCQHPKDRKECKDSVPSRHDPNICDWRRIDILGEENPICENPNRKE